MSWAARCASALDPKAAGLLARAGGALDPAAAWLKAHDCREAGVEWEDEPTEKQLRSAARRARGQSSFKQVWSGWSDQDAADPFEMLAAAQSAAALDAAALAAAALAADWEAMDTLRHAEACRITRRRAQQLRAWHLQALALQGVLV
ncbi:hypothetical protein [Thiomonas sp.]|jgi:hypothetical protein|uniref:hypothetical protein n=1 Tax=Thiomonas sp. TaxID=2047785 RepID=UPI002587585E|nr:hypothetical protein [Thiomonas sp.]